MNSPSKCLFTDLPHKTGILQIPKDLYRFTLAHYEPFRQHGWCYADWVTQYERFYLFCHAGIFTMFFCISPLRGLTGVNLLTISNY